MKRTMTFLLGLALSFSAEALAGTQPMIEMKAYRMVSEGSLHTVNEGRVGDPVQLPEGLEMVELETKGDALLGNLVKLGLDAEENSGLPTEIWVQERELANPSLQPLEGAGAGWEVLKRMTYCYRYVKKYLLAIGKVKSYLPGGSAYQAASILPKHGFRRTGHSPASASNGEVCVYRGGPQGHGHIEVKRNGKWWYGYGFINHPIRNRKFVACFAK